MHRPILTEKEKAIFQFIKYYLGKHGWGPTYREIQNHFEYKSIGSINDFVKQLERKNYVVLDDNSSSHTIKLAEEFEPADAIKVPLLGRVAAGHALEVVEQTNHYIDVPRALMKKSGEYFALKVTGNSMIEDCIMDGDIVVVRSQTSAENGQTVIAVINNEATIKRYFKRKDTIELEPANPEFRTRVVRDDEAFSIKGILIGVIRKLG